MNAWTVIEVTAVICRLVISVKSSEKLLGTDRDHKSCGARYLYSAFRRQAGQPCLIRRAAGRRAAEAAAVCILASPTRGRHCCTLAYQSYHISSLHSSASCFMRCGNLNTDNKDLVPALHSTHVYTESEASLVPGEIAPPRPSQTLALLSAVSSSPAAGSRLQTTTS